MKNDNKTIKTLAFTRNCAMDVCTVFYLVSFSTFKAVGQFTVHLQDLVDEASPVHGVCMVIESIDGPGNGHWLSSIMVGILCGLLVSGLSSLIRLAIRYLVGFLC